METQNKMTYTPGVHDGKPIIMKVAIVFFCIENLRLFIIDYHNLEEQHIRGR
jgi:hypothetical protein